MKFLKNSEKYHLNDSVRDSLIVKDGFFCEDISRCGGYDDFIRSYPEFREWVITQKYDSSLINSDLYMRFFDEKGMTSLLYDSIETVRVEELGAILLAEAEVYFQLLSLQTQKRLNTSNIENKIKNLKEGILILSRYKGYMAVKLEYVKTINDSTSYGIVRMLPGDINVYSIDEGKNIIGLVPVPYLDKIYIIVPSDIVEDVHIELKFDGTNFVALYKDNLPSSVFERGLLVDISNNSFEEENLKNDISDAIDASEEDVVVENE